LSELDPLWIAGIPPLTAGGWIIHRLVSTLCAAWLERCRRKTALAIMDKAGQMQLAIEHERRKGGSQRPSPARPPPTV
jgi:hypothetical protein